MQTLFSIVTYNHKHYAELESEQDRRTIEKLIAKLQFLESDIVVVANGSINISPAGNIFIDKYPPQLARQMNAV